MAANSPVLDRAPAEPLTLPKWQIWTGRVLSALPVLLLALSASMKLTQNPGLVEKLTSTYGYPASAIVAIGVAEIVSAVLYAIPRTAVLGAVLVTGYLGGAVATHVRIGESFALPLLIGVLAWAGLFLRDERVRALLPLRS